METKEMRFWGDRSFVFFSLQEEHSPDSRSNSFISLLMPLPSWFLCILLSCLFLKNHKKKKKKWVSWFLLNLLILLLSFSVSLIFPPPSSSSLFFFPIKERLFPNDRCLLHSFIYKDNVFWLISLVHSMSLFVLLLDLPAVVFSHLYISCRLLMSLRILSVFSVFRDIFSSFFDRNNNWLHFDFLSFDFFDYTQCVFGMKTNALDVRIILVKNYIQVS